VVHLENKLEWWVKRRRDSSPSPKEEWKISWEVCVWWAQWPLIPKNLQQAVCGVCVWRWCPPLLWILLGRNALVKAQGTLPQLNKSLNPSPHKSSLTFALHWVSIFLFMLAQKRALSNAANAKYFFLHWVGIWEWERVHWGLFAPPPQHKYMQRSWYIGLV
jgi:hypothetical protein